MRLVLRVTILVALAALVSACGGAPEDRSAPAAPEPSAVVPPRPVRPAEALVGRPEVELRVPAGYRARRVPEAGAQLAVPLGWIALTRLDAVHPGARQVLTAIDERIARPLAALGIPDSPLKLLVLAPERDGGFPATITLVVASEDDVRPFAAWARDSTARLLALTHVRGGVATRSVRLPVGQAVRLRYRRASGDGPAAAVAYLARGGGHAYYLALTSRRHEAAYTRAFDGLARSLTTMRSRVGVLTDTGAIGKA